MSIEYENVEIDGYTYQFKSTNNATKGEIMDLKKPMYNSKRYHLLSYLDELFISQPRTAKVLKLRFGLEIGDYCEECGHYKKGKSHSLEDVAKIIASSMAHPTRERVRQIEAKGLRLLRGELPKESPNTLMAFTETAPQFMMAVGLVNFQSNPLRIR